MRDESLQQKQSDEKGLCAGLCSFFLVCFAAYWKKPVFRNKVARHRGISKFWPAKAVYLVSGDHGHLEHTAFGFFEEASKSSNGLGGYGSDHSSACCVFVVRRRIVVLGWFPILAMEKSIGIVIFDEELHEKT